MKTKSPQEVSVTVTTTTSLTIKGQTFEMSLDELKALHEKIGKAIGADVPKIQFVPVDKPERIRPYYPPQWPWQLERKSPAPPLPKSPEITCSTAQLDDFRHQMSKIVGPDTAKAMLP